MSLASVAALMGFFGQANYAPSKAGVIALTKVAAREFARQNVLVNAVSPGLIETEVVAALSAEKRKELLLDVALGRVGRPEEVAELVALQADYARWLDAIPDATRDGATAEALQAIVELQLDDIIAIQPPRRFGRD